MAEFSFEQDVAPYASKFFAEVGADPRLSNASKNQLQGSLLTGVGEIEKQRLAIQDERQQGRYRSLQIAEGESALEDARRKRARIEQEAGRVQGVRDTVQSIVASPEDPEVKQQRLVQLELDNADLNDPVTRNAFDAGSRLIPAAAKPRFTPAQIASFAEDVPPDVLARQDPMEIGQYLGFAAQQKEQREVKKAAIKESETERSKLLDRDLEFDEAEDGTEAWLKPESTQDAEIIVEEFGTPEEQAKFGTLKNAPSDHARALLVQKIQTRERLKKLRGGSNTDRLGFTGLPGRR